MWAVKYKNTDRFVANKMSMEPTQDPKYIMVRDTPWNIPMWSDEINVEVEYDSEGIIRETAK
jgi:hypothetical protein